MNDPLYIVDAAGNILVVFVLIASLARLKRRLAANGERTLAAASVAMIVLITSWFFATAVIGWSGVFWNDPVHLPPRIAYGILVPLVVGLAILLTANPMRAALDRIPLHWLIGVQLYRVLGGEFLLLLAQKRLPSAFALSAGWGDVAVGLLAPFVALMVFKRSKHWFGAVVAWNILGILDLATAVTLGVGSSPGPLRFIAQDPSSVIMSEFPMVLIPTFAVPLSWLLHVQSLRIVKRNMGDSEVTSRFSAARA